MPQTERPSIAIATVTAAFVSYVAYTHPTLIPVLTLAITAWMAAVTFLKM